jgi:hypothetical protein
MMASKELRKIFIQILNNGEKLYKSAYESYKSAGSPYGETEKGMMKWLKERRKKAEIEYRENCEREIKAMIKEIEENQKEAHVD